MEIHYHGHSCFELRDGEYTLLVDPFLAPNNPKARATADDVSPTHIAMTHAHADHVADAVAVATRTGAECVAIVELAEWLSAQGVENVADPNLGGTISFPWGSVKLVQAFHTNTAPGSPDHPFSPIDGTVIGTGGNIFGPLGAHGIGDKAITWGPIFTRAIAIATGSSHSLALRADGRLWHWGRDIGLEPAAIPDDVTAAAADSSGSIALRRDGTLWQWDRGGMPAKHFDCP